jgi:hypothetical protein
MIKLLEVPSEFLLREGSEGENDKGEKEMVKGRWQKEKRHGQDEIRAHTSILVHVESCQSLVMARRLGRTTCKGQASVLCRFEIYQSQISLIEATNLLSRKLAGVVVVEAAGRRELEHHTIMIAVVTLRP